MKIKSVLIVVVASGSALLLFACGAAVVKQVGVQQIRDNAMGKWVCDMSGTSADGSFKNVATVDIAESTFSLSVAQTEPAAHVRGGFDRSGTGTWSYDGNTLSMQFLSDTYASDNTLSNEPVFHWYGITDPLDAVAIEWLHGYHDPENPSTKSAMSVKIISARHISASGPYNEDYDLGNVAYDCIKSN